LRQHGFKQLLQVIQILRVLQQRLQIGRAVKKKINFVCGHRKGETVNIIFVPGSLGRSRTIALSGRQLLLLGALWLLLPLLLTAVLYYATLLHAGDIRNPYFSSLILNAQKHEANRAQHFLQENLNAMSMRLGQIQSQLLRLDALGERLAMTAGIKPNEFRMNQPPGRGGAQSSLPAHQLSLDEFQRMLNQLGRQIEDRSDKLGVLDSILMQANLKKLAVPSLAPVEVGWSSSNYGWRIDPFDGQESFHEGLDFVADVGTKVVAAAGGVVIYSDYHAEYGNMIEVDHGNGLVTRYGHASKRLVKVGDIVLKGQKIAEVGNTGRSTGAHLHFEVRLHGAPQNPARFLHLPG